MYVCVYVFTLCPPVKYIYGRVNRLAYTGNGRHVEDIPSAADSKLRKEKCMH